MSQDDNRTRNARTPAAVRPWTAETVAAPDEEPRSPAPETVPRPAGEQLGSYQLVRELGSGGMGKVYLARHVRLGREVAIKTLRAELAQDRESVTRFFNEARTVNAINHEHIVEIFDFIDEPGDPPRVYCVMELLAGQNLSKALKSGPMPLSRIIDIAQQTAEALAAAHRAGVIHRDIKPANLMLTTRGGREDFVKVLDFGIAKSTGAALAGGEAPSTRTGFTLGTPEYMAPEQALSKPVDARVDIYALGLTLYEMLAGRRPFDAESTAQLLVQLVTEPPAALPGRTATGEAIPVRLADLVMRCLKKRPEERPQSMDEVVAELAQLFPRGTTGAFEVKPPAPKPRSIRLWVAAGAVLLIAAAGLAGRSLWSRPQPSPAPQAAPALAQRAVISTAGNAAQSRAAPAPVAVAAHPAASAPVAHAAAPAPRPEPAAAKTPIVQNPKTAIETPPPAAVSLEVRTTPPGATVIRADTGETLGQTPLETKIARAGDVRLRLVKAGFVASTQEIRLSSDVRLNVALRKVAVPVRRKVRHREATRKETHPVDRDAPLDPFASP